MAIQQLIIILLIAFLLSLSSGIAFYLYNKKKVNKKETAIIIKQNKNNTSLNQFYLDSYNKVFKYKIFRKTLLRLRRRIETLGVYDDMDVRRQVMKLVYHALLIFASVVILLIIFRPGWVMVFWIIVGLLFLSGLLIDQFINKTEIKLLEQLKYYNSRIRHYYQQSKMVDEAAYEAIADVGPEMKIQATRIHEILMKIGRAHV